MTRQQSQLVRLLLMCAAWAVGQVLTLGLSAPGLDTLVPAGLAIGVYVITEDLGRPAATTGNARYWRGRRIDDEAPRKDRWN
ncbi:MAG TPA: hypothetical protein VM052_02420 [Candidatus Limnocylindrales bacterium]|nr:hypothetical protein [Candidatus Limnocylindrales bacterium]